MLPPTLWTDIIQLVIEHNPRNLLSILQLNKFFYTIASTNHLYFLVWKHLFPKLNQTTIYRPHIHYRSKIQATHVQKTRWSVSNVFKQQRTNWKRKERLFYNLVSMEFVRQVFPDVSDLKIMGILADYNFELKSDSQYLGISLLGQQDGTFGCFLVIDLGLNIVQCQKTRLDDGLVTFQFLSVSENQCVLVYQNWQGEWSRMCVHRLSDWHKIYEIPLQPQLTIQRIFSRSSGLVMLGWDKERQGIVMHLDHSGTIVKCITFGEKITCFGESHPYIPDCCVTGHENKIVCIWTLDGQLKHTLVGHRKNIWGFAFMDDPDDRDSDTLHWKEPHRLMLISVADDGSLSEHAELLTWVIDTQPTVKPLTEHWMTFPRGDLFATFYVVFPYIYSLSFHGQFSVLNLETSELVFSIPRLANIDLEQDFQIFNIVRPGNRLLIFLKQGIFEIPVHSDISDPFDKKMIL